MGYKVGDYVRIKIEKDAGWLRVVSKSQRYPPDEDKCTYKQAQICGIYQMRGDDYIVLIDFDPHSYFSFKIEQWHQKGYDVEDKFLGMRGAYIDDEHIWPAQTAGPAQQVKLNKPGGMGCKLCLKFIQYAGVNRDDGSFVCKRCRDTRGYKLTCKPLK